MALLLFFLLGVPCCSNTPLFYSVLNYYQHFYLVLSGGLGALTAPDPLLANRLVINIFSVDCTKFSGLCCHLLKKITKKN